jgi:predicted ATP-dependent protease
VEEKIVRSNLVETRVRELIARGTLLIRVSGEVVGQVNGLVVVNLGDYEFGRPSRITASVGPGREGVLDIEREVELGGPIHSKGVLILAGYLTRVFGPIKPLSLGGRLVFEQSYDGVEGDSASSAELYALLSALSGLGLRQGVAVTGSVNQLGEVQAVGGVNEKIEGFFGVCKAAGLDGSHGVVIPRSNLRSLMLREEVVEAVRSRKFRIWAVSTVEEGIGILTGVSAGRRGRGGAFPKGSVFARVEERLRVFSQALQEPPRERGRTPGKRRRGKGRSWKGRRASV